jgi:hypothetical protein
MNERSSLRCTVRQTRRYSPQTVRYLYRQAKRRGTARPALFQSLWHQNALRSHWLQELLLAEAGSIIMVQQAQASYRQTRICQWRRTGRHAHLRGHLMCGTVHGIPYWEKGRERLLQAARNGMPARETYRSGFFARPGPHTPQECVQDNLFDVEVRGASQRIAVQQSICLTTY